MRIVPIVEVMIACCPNSDSTASGETRSARSEQSWSCALLKSLSRTASTNASTLRLACCSTWSLPATTSRPKPKRPPAQHRTNATPPTASPIHRLRRLRSIGGAANGGATPGPGGGAVTGPEGGCPVADAGDDRAARRGARQHLVGGGLVHRLGEQWRGVHLHVERRQRPPVRPDRLPVGDQAPVPRVVQRPGQPAVAVARAGGQGGEREPGSLDERPLLVDHEPGYDQHARLHRLGSVVKDREVPW